jgi:hypothetical protein
MAIETRKIKINGISVAEIKESEKESDKIIPNKSSFLKFTPLRIWGKIMSAPNPIIEEKLKTNPMTTGLLKVSSTSPGTQAERTASAKNAKKRIIERVVIFCHTGSVKNEIFNLRNIYIFIVTQVVLSIIYRQDDKLKLKKSSMKNGRSTSQVKYILILISKVIILFLLLCSPLLLPKNIYACRDCSDGAGCSSCGAGWFCSLDIHCCKCICGGGTKQDFGPVECFSEPDHNVYGCLPCGPTDPPGPTATTAPTATPPPPKFWLCMRPYSENPPKCDYSDDIYCQTFDIPGGLCFKTVYGCEAGCFPLSGTTLTPLPSMNPLCTFAPGRYGIKSAIGCIPVDNQNETTIFILRWAMGVSSGIVFLLIIYSGFLIMGSGGNTEKVKAGKELMTAALTGLVLIIFSVFVLDIFGLRIFRLPGMV